MHDAASTVASGAWRCGVRGEGDGISPCSGRMGVPASRVAVPREATLLCVFCSACFKDAAVEAPLSGGTPQDFTAEAIGDDHC